MGSKVSCGSIFSFIYLFVANRSAVQLKHAPSVNFPERESKRENQDNNTFPKNKSKLMNMATNLHNGKNT